MWYSDSRSRRLILSLAVGIGVLALVFASLFFVINNPVQAEDPPDLELDPRLMAIDPGLMAASDLPIRVSANYTDDILEEGYPADHTVWITVTNHAGATKATIELWTQDIEHWTPFEPGVWATGFSTELGTWIPAKPDIVVGDIVYVKSDEGYETSMQVGEITGEVSTTLNRVTGTVYAPWILPDDVRVKCMAFSPLTGNRAQVFDEAANRSTDPDGEDVYTCDFNPVGWQLQPSHLVAVSYDPLIDDGRSNRSLTVLQVPGPHLQIKKWAPGRAGVLDGAPGNLIMNIEYRNIGTVDATSVVITDTMEGLTYLGDTSGIVPTGTGTAGDPLRWEIGTVPAGEHVQFQVFATITAAATTRIHNDVGITSGETNQGFPSERRDSWSTEVTPQGAWLTAHKNTWTRSPVPGEPFVYEINVCNTRQRWTVDSGETTVTDTLPDGTQMIDWWSEEAGWELESATGQTLVFTRDSVAADACSFIYVRVALDEGVAPGDELCNTVAVTATNINTPVQYRQDEICHTAGLPIADLMIDKTWAGGQLVAGGHLRYEVVVRNTGNVPIAGPVTVTDLMPQHTSFVDAEADPDAPFTFAITPVQIGNQLVWEFTDINPGEWARFWLTLDIDEGEPVGAELVNTIIVAAGELEDTAVWTEMIHASGPNLRVRKTGEWANSGMNPHRINYRIDVENVGDQRAYELALTDEFDGRMQWVGPIFVDFWYDHRVEIGFPGATRFITASLEMLEPGESFGIEFDTWLATADNLYPAVPVASGLVFTNAVTVTSPLAGEDTAVAINVTGPDLQLEKAHTAGIALPGELVTFTLTVRNARPDRTWWWGLQGDAIVTDTLPTGLTFVSASLWLCEAEGEFWCDAPPQIDNQTLTWNLGALAAGEINMIRLVARVDGNVSGGTQLTNQATITSTDPVADAEVDTDNNTDTATVVVPDVTYTLTVNIVGQGTVTVNPDQPAYEQDDEVTLTATPAQGWAFVGWSGDASATEPTITITIEADTTLTATFIEEEEEVHLMPIYLPILLNNWMP